MITIDSQAGVVTVEDGGRTRTLRMDEPEAFRVVSEAWRSSSRSSTATPSIRP